MGFTGFSITAKGRTLLANAQSGAVLDFTRMQIGTGSLNLPAKAEEMTALVEPLCYLPIAQKQVTNQNAVVKAQLSNHGRQTFRWRELGLWAADPIEGEILYAYGNAGDNADTIPDGSVSPVEFTFSMIIGIGNATNVTVQTDPSIVMATKADITTHAADTALHPPALQQADWDSKAAGSHTHTPAAVGADPAGSAATAKSEAITAANSAIAAVDTKVTTHIADAGAHTLTATATRTGTVVALTVHIPSGVTTYSIRFLAPSDFASADTYTINGTALTLTDLKGMALEEAWKSGAPIELTVTGGLGFFKAGGFGARHIKEVIYEDTTWIPPKGIKGNMVTVTCVGGGGSGGLGFSSGMVSTVSGDGGGGGSGFVITQNVPVDAANIAIKIGRERERTMFGDLLIALPGENGGDAKYAGGMTVVQAGTPGKGGNPGIGSRGGKGYGNNAIGGADLVPGHGFGSGGGGGYAPAIIYQQEKHSAGGYGEDGVCILEYDLL